MRRVSLFLLFMMTLFVTAVPVLAQTEEPAAGIVTGQIINQTPGGSTPDGMELMLHAWDETFAQKLMLNGQSGAEGEFQFEDVTLNPDWLYAVMLTYEDVLYFSEPAAVTENQTTLNLEIPIFDVTSDTSQVQVEQQHILFDATEEELLVVEIYILSNLGDKTIMGAGADDVQSPLSFSLPEGAVNVTFIGDEDGRYLLTPSGFADTTPLRPSVGKSQVVVQYELPYADSLAYSLTAQWPVATVNFLLPEAIGLSLEGDDLVNEGTRDMSTGESVTSFSYAALEPGDSLAVTLRGSLILSPESMPSATAADLNEQPAARTPLALGGIVLGLALIAVGIWWYRRPDDDDDYDDESEDTRPETAGHDFDDLVMQIASLDEAHDLGEMDDETYQLERAALRQQAASGLHQANPA